MSDCNKICSHYLYFLKYTTTYEITAYRHWCCEFESRSGRGIPHYAIKFVSDLRQTGRWFSPGPPVSSTNKIDRHDITEILLKVALNAIKQTNNNKTICICNILSLLMFICTGGDFIKLKLVSYPFVLFCMTIKYV